MIFLKNKGFVKIYLFVPLLLLLFIFIFWNNLWILLNIKLLNTKLNDENLFIKPTEIVLNDVLEKEIFTEFTFKDIKFKLPWTEIKDKSEEKVINIDKLKIVTSDGKSIVLSIPNSYSIAALKDLINRKNDDLIVSYPSYDALKEIMQITPKDINILSNPDDLKNKYSILNLKNEYVSNGKEYIFSEKGFDIKTIEEKSQNNTYALNIFYLSKKIYIFNISGDNINQEDINFIISSIVVN